MESGNIRSDQFMKGHFKPDSRQRRATAPPGQPHRWKEAVFKPNNSDSRRAVEREPRTRPKRSQTDSNTTQREGPKREPDRWKPRGSFKPYNGMDTRPDRDKPTATAHTRRRRATGAEAGPPVYRWSEPPHQESRTATPRKPQF